MRQKGQVDGSLLEEWRAGFGLSKSDCAVLLGIGGGKDSAGLLIGAMIRREEKKGDEV